MSRFAANARLDVLFRDVCGRAGKQRLQRAACILEETADADEFEANAQIRRQRAAVVDRALPTNTGWACRWPITFSAPSASTAMAATSAESMPPLRPTSTLRESALAHVVARAQHQRLIGSFGVVVRVDGAAIAGAAKWCRQRPGPRQRSRLRDQIAVGHRARSDDPSKIRLSLPPTWFDHHHREPSAGARWPPASRGASPAFAVPEGRRRKVDMDGRIRLRASALPPDRRDRAGAARKFLSFQASSQMVMRQAHAIQLDAAAASSRARSSAARRRRRRRAAAACDCAELD